MSREAVTCKVPPGDRVVMDQSAFSSQLWFKLDPMAKTALPTLAPCCCGSRKQLLSNPATTARAGHQGRDGLVRQRSGQDLYRFAGRVHLPPGAAVQRLQNGCSVRVLDAEPGPPGNHHDVAIAVWVKESPTHGSVPAAPSQFPTRRAAILLKVAGALFRSVVRQLVQTGVTHLIPLTGLEGEQERAFLQQNLSRLDRSRRKDASAQWPRAAYLNLREATQFVAHCPGNQNKKTLRRQGEKETPSSVNNAPTASRSSAAVLRDLASLGLITGFLTSIIICSVSIIAVGRSGGYGDVVTSSSCTPADRRHAQAI